MKKIYMICLLFCSVLVACTEVDLCYEEHPHSSFVSFNYDWNNMSKNESELIDSMTVVCNRVINSRRQTLGLETAENTGKYDILPDTLSEAENSNISEFGLPSGEYKFYTLNRAGAGVKYKNLNEFVNYDESLHGFGNIWMEYETQNYADSQEKPNIEWTDLNPYQHLNGEEALYLNPDMCPLVIDSTGVVSIKANETKQINFTSKLLSQNIDIYFDIKKERGNIDFTVDSVYCIISGVPHSINVATGRLNVAETDKMLFKTRLVDPNTVPTVSSANVEDTYNNKVVRCYRNVNVTGIVENDKAGDDVFYGPGIMQALIYVGYTDASNQKQTRIVNGIVNIHNSIVKAKLQTFDKDYGYYHKTKDHNVLYIKIDATIKQSYLNGSGTGGIDNWSESTVQGEGEDGGFDIY